MKILADSSIWIDHFRNPNEALPSLIGIGRLRIHPYVITELALGSVPDRARLLGYLKSLPSFVPSAPDGLLEFIELHNLNAKGVGMVDAELLKVCVEGETLLWTADKRLAAQSERLDLAYTP